MHSAPVRTTSGWRFGIGATILGHLGTDLLWHVAAQVL